MGIDSTTRQTSPYKRSLTITTLVNIALRLLFVILLISGISYWHLMSQLANETHSRLLSYITERGQREESIFVLAEDNHSLLRNEFLEQFNSKAAKAEAFQFDQQFSHWSDGTVRSVPEGTDSKAFDSVRQPTSFLQQGVELTTDIQRRLTLSYELVQQYGAGWRDRFLDTYISLPEGAMTILWPGAAWGIDADAQLDIPLEEWAYLGDKIHNPERKTLWTGIYADPVTQDWMVSVETPIDGVDGRHLGTIGHDIVLAELIERVVNDHLEGVENLLVRADGQLIAESSSMEQVQAAGGKLTVYNASNPHLERIFALVQDISQTDDVVYNRADREYLAIARLNGPDWYLVTVYPEKLLQAQVLSNTWFLLGLGLASLAIEVLLFWRVLKRQIAAPLGDFLEATQQVTAGNFTVDLDTQRPDELGQLSTAFTQMTQQLQAAFTDLEQTIAQQQQTEIASRKIQDRLAFVIKQNPIAIIEWDTEFKVVGWNPAAEKIFRYSADEMLGQQALEIVPEPYRPHVVELMTALSKQQGGQYSVNPNLRSDGELITCEWFNTPLRNSENQVIGVFSMVQDVSDRLRNQEAITQKSEDLERALTELKTTQLRMVQTEKMSALGNLVSGVAHEINNPTGFLKGNIQPALGYVQDLFGLIDVYQAEYPQSNAVVEDEIDAIDLEFVRDDLPKLIASMESGIDRIRSISDGLRIFSRQDQDTKTAFNIHDGIDSTLLILKHRTKANDLRPSIQIRKSYGDLTQFQCFPGQLNQVFMNIIANAIDALDEANRGKTYQEIEANPNIINIHTSIMDGRVQIQIEDNGCGMKQETADRIFEQGFTTKGVGKGTGLGMAIAHQIVTEKHGGTIACTSKLGQGSVFRITLPM